MNSNDLARTIHEQAVKSGFWDASRNEGEMLMLAVSELSEALEEHRGGKPPMYYLASGDLARIFPIDKWNMESIQGKPEGHVIELADCYIRLMDTLYFFTGGNVEEVMAQNQMIVSRLIGPRDNFADELAHIAKEILIALDVHDRKAQAFHLSRAAVLCQRLALVFVDDFMEAVTVKMRYNSQREFMHGKAY